MQHIPSESLHPPSYVPGPTGQPLPLELYQTICSHLSRGDLVQLLKTCRTLFDLVVPLVWYEVELIELLKLLPGCTPIRNSYDCRMIGIKILPPRPLPQDYFSRVYLYARGVERLIFSTGKIITGTYSQEPARTSILERLSSHVLLPHLKFVHLSLIGRAEDDRSSRFWLAALLPNTVKNLEVSIISNSNLPYLESILPKCSGLTQLRLHPPCYGDRIAFWKYIHTEFNAPGTLEVLSVCDGASLNDVLLWSSKMPKLRSLYIHAYDGEHHHLFPPEISHPESFQSLRYLSIRIYRDYKMWRAMSHAWRTLSLSHLTCLKISGDQLDLDFESAGEFLTIVTARSPNITNFSVEECDPRSWQLFPLRHLLNLCSLPLRKLTFQRLTDLEASSEQPMLKTVGILWPELEELGLSVQTTGFEIYELLKVQAYLPNLRKLRVSFWSRDAFSEESALKLNDNLLKHTYTPSLPLENTLSRPSLTLDFRYMGSDGGQKCDFTYLGALIRALAAYWSIRCIRGAWSRGCRTYLQSQIRQVKEGRTPEAEYP